MKLDWVRNEVTRMRGHPARLDAESDGYFRPDGAWAFESVGFFCLLAS
ncbi:hypothetical protein ACVWY3_001052 [Bradyrhizobium sp. USDA 4486]